ncbi:MAG: sigma-70 family RNA polymerase sigma factor [Verrucomicrobiales bacterium]
MPKKPQENELFAKNPEWKKAYLKTRKSLIERLDNWEDQRTWDEFYKTYWRLIYSVALKAGLRSDEAFDVVQETIISLAKQTQKENKYDPAQGSFKSWLMNMTRWRIADQFRKRAKDTHMNKGDDDDDRTTATLDRYADPNAEVLEQVWDNEWKKNLAERALDLVKTRVSPKQYQIFDCYVVKGWEAKKVTKELGVSMAQVYLAKHRIGSLIKKEVAELEKQMI